MIPATHITIDGHTAWYVVTDNEHNDAAFQWDKLDRPCDTCDSLGCGIYCDQPDDHPCPAHCIDGRHTFDIEVQCGTWADCSPTCSGVNTLRVSIVPGMVLPIVEQTGDGDCPDDAHICVFYGHMGGEPHEQWVLYDGDCMEREIVTMPAAAAPGMFAVQLKVAR